MQCPVVVGRDEELTALAEMFGRVAAGRGARIVVTGEAGVGETGLVAEVLAVGGTARPVDPAHIQLARRRTDPSRHLLRRRPLPRGQAGPLPQITQPTSHAAPHPALSAPPA